MDAPLRVRLTEEDMNQRVHHMMQQRQQTEIPHPQAYMQPPPSPIRVGGHQQHHPSSQQQQQQQQRQQQYAQEPLWHAQEHFHQQQQQQPLNEPQHSYHPHQQQHQQHSLDNYSSHAQQQGQQNQVEQSYSMPPPQQQQRKQRVESFHETQQIDEHPLPIPSTTKMTSSPKQKRQQIICLTPNDINLIDLQTLPDTKITAARVLNISFPLIDYNVDETTRIFEFSTNRLDAKAQHWQQASLPLGHFTSRYKLLDALTDTLTSACEVGHFVSHLDRYGTNICSIEAIFLEEDYFEHNGLYFNVAHNTRLFEMFGFDDVEKEGQESDTYVVQWATTKTVHKENVTTDDSLDESTRNQVPHEIKFRHFQVYGKHPMNLSAPTNIKLQIPELNNWYNHIGINKARHGEYTFYEFIDDDGVVDLTHPQLGGCSDLTRITPKLSTCHRNKHGSMYERPYNCRNMPIALTIELMLTTKTET